jgi:transcription antitermination factor NusG
MMAWHVAYTHAGAEKRVRDGLKRRGIAAVWLHHQQRRRQRGNVLYRERSLFPRYVLVEIVAAAQFELIRDCDGVAHILFMSGRPLELPTPVVEELRAKGDTDGLMVGPREEVARIRWACGQEARVRSGPLVTFLALVRAVSGDRVRVWVDGLMGGREVDMPAAWLEPVDTPNGGA